MATPKYIQMAQLLNKGFSISETFSKEEACEYAELTLGAIRIQTWNALIKHNFIKEVPNGFQLVEPIQNFSINSATKPNSKANTLTIRKEKAQYYAQYFEEAIVSYTNKETPVNNTNYSFTADEIQIMNEDAKITAEIFNGTKAIYKGRHTTTESCDLEIDGQEIEVKYGKSDGTYYNTSISYFNTFGLKPFKDYLKEFGVLDYLAQFFGEKVYENESPVSQDESSKFQKDKKHYDELKKLESQARVAYVKDIFDYLNLHNEAKEQFAKDMLTKENSGKHIPDILFIYHYDKDEYKTISKDKILHFSTDEFQIAGSYTLKFKDFKATIAWQNGTGLNNPTIRIFFN